MISWGNLSLVLSKWTRHMTAFERFKRFIFLSSWMRRLRLTWKFEMCYHFFFFTFLNICFLFFNLTKTFRYPFYFLYPILAFKLFVLWCCMCQTLINRSHRSCPCRNNCGQTNTSYRLSRYSNEIFTIKHVKIALYLYGGEVQWTEIEV